MMMWMMLAIEGIFWVWFAVSERGLGVALIVALWTLATATVAVCKFFPEGDQSCQ